MPWAIPVPIRRSIVERHQAGQGLTPIALELDLPVGVLDNLPDSTVRFLWLLHRPQPWYPMAPAPPADPYARHNHMIAWVKSVDSGPTVGNLVVR